MKDLLVEIRDCQVCASFLDHEPRPVVDAHPDARVLIIGQAPGTRVHESGIPWNDPSGNRLRQWMDVDRDQFYDPKHFAIVPMGFCYPGKGKSGDLPPRPECAPLWHKRILKALPNIELTLLIGMYAQAYYLGDGAKRTLTETVASWRDYLPDYIVMPHPSPRNQFWLTRNTWFEQDVVPELRDRVMKSFAS